jgi:signal transduction histidine kinase
MSVHENPFNNEIRDTEQNNLDEIWAAGTIASILASNKYTLDEKLEKSLSVTLHQIAAASGYIMLLNRQRELVVRQATNKSLIGKKMSLSKKGNSNGVPKEGKALIIPDIKLDPELPWGGVCNTNFCICAPIFAKEKVIGIINVMDKIGSGTFSISDQRKLEQFVNNIAVFIENARLSDEMTKEMKRLKRRNCELRKLVGMKQDLTNMVVHDLKGPIGEVMANLDMLSYENLSEASREYLESAMVGCDTLLRMVLNLLDVSRIEGKKLRLHLEEFNVIDMINDVVRKMQMTALCKGITIEVKSDNGCILWTADKSLIERILSNLISNAIKFSKESGGIEIDCHVDPSPDRLSISVSDQGQGIPKDMQKRIFDKFVSSSYEKGTGLGLTLCRMATHAHGGTIRLKSEPDIGSTFTLVFPMEVSVASRL